jgi:hypothetical protein
MGKLKDGMEPQEAAEKAAEGHQALCRNYRFKTEVECLETYQPPEEADQKDQGNS